eukprot:scaffold1328_cov394-Prasinococcus_capsulatus_cf.AAC.26
MRARPRAGASARPLAADAAGLDLARARARKAPPSCKSAPGARRALAGGPRRGRRGGRSAPGGAASWNGSSRASRKSGKQRREAPEWGKGGVRGSHRAPRGALDEPLPYGESRGATPGRRPRSCHQLQQRRRRPHPTHPRLAGSPNRSAASRGDGCGALERGSALAGARSRACGLTGWRRGGGQRAARASPYVLGVAVAATASILPPRRNSAFGAAQLCAALVCCSPILCASMYIYVYAHRSHPQRSSRALPSLPWRSAQYGAGAPGTKTEATTLERGGWRRLLCAGHFASGPSTRSRSVVCVTSCFVQVPPVIYEKNSACISRL